MKPGDTLGPYEILSPLGAGGMGEVYKARDTRLERMVAIKVLPEELAGDPERRARLEREAKAVSQLNHTHICTFHDIGHDDGVDFLVMEYLDGETLADRLARGPLPLDEAVRYARQIAEALVAAHRRGVVHRDLKPGNIMLTKAGVKLMDFGLARVETPTAETDSVAPTAAKPLTQEGAVMGTVPYMAPEQLEGKTADARTDVFAYGAVVYEMVTGRRAFEGESQASTIAAIMGSEPKRLRELQPLTPVMLDAIVTRALAKDPDERWQSVRDIDLVLDLDSEPESETPIAPRRLKLAWLVASVAIVAGFSLGWLVRRSPEPEVARMTLSLPEGEDFRGDAFPAFAVSHDGRRVVFSTRPLTESPTTLYLRELDRFETRAFPEIANALQPAFSPDGKFVAYATAPEPSIVKLALDDGVVTKVTDVTDRVNGIAWTSEGEILFGTDKSGIMRVPAQGGIPRPVTSLVPGDINHHTPKVLPGGRGIVFTVLRGSGFVVAVQPAGAQEHEIVTEGYRASYVPSGHLVFGRQGTSQIFAAPFDLDTLTMEGPAITVEDRVFVYNNTHPQFQIAEEGTLVYASGGTSTTSVIWVTRDGETETVVTYEGRYHSLDLSPDGRRFVADEGVAGNERIWGHDLDRGARFLFETGVGLHVPRFTPSGREVAFAANNGDIFIKSADGTGIARLILKKEPPQYPLSFSPDGRLLAITETSPVTGKDIWVVPLDGEPQPFIVTSAQENAAAFSPNGDWIAYQSNESGRPEIYVQPFPGPGERVLISTGGGKEPIWSPDEEELFYRQGTAVVAVAIETTPSLRAGTPQILFDGPYQADITGHPTYDVSPDGTRFLMIQNESAERMKLQVVLNFAEELESRVPR